MISRSLNINIIVRVFLIVALSILMGYLLFVQKSVRFSIICFLVIIFLTINLIAFLNTTNKKIRYFFDSVRNDDSNLYFPVEIKDSSVREIYKRMNQVNQQIQQLKIENSRQEKYFRILLEHLATGIITYDSRGFVLHANTAAKKLMSLDVLTHIQQIDRIDQKLFMAIRDIKPSERRLISFSAKSGEIQLSLKATSFNTNSNELIILSIQDIKNELDEKELESWMKLIRVLMHEIMNSITPITSLSDSLYNIYVPDGEPILPENVTDKTIHITTQGLNVIREQGKGLMSFVDSYRQLTRIPVPQKRKFRISDLLSRVKILYHSLPKSEKVILEIEQEENSLEIFADENQVSLVLINLLKNAIEANENNPSGIITVTAGHNSENQPEISVSDNGPGIPEDNLEKIFIPFFTTRNEGSGIGLSISKQIMRMHGGTLKVKSIQGRETVFSMNFNPCPSI
jgi:two-component system, NtrC family, nitrogen regulation sensor histidine kinase NtrY